MSPALEEQSATKILVPISTFVDRTRLFKALQVLATLKDPVIILFRVVEVPHRTNPLDPDLWKEDIKKAENYLNGVAAWLRQEGYRADSKVRTARNTGDGIISEANNGEYAVVLMMKRRIRTGWSRMFHKSITEEVIRYANPLVLTFLAEIEPGERKAK